ncbi:MAG: hypothetical protein OK455_09170 [Thaumarchaeota archaeon]|nr:hypothetical protein [Nitrososphaerota archaeon]
MVEIRKDYFTDKLSVVPHDRAARSHFKSLSDHDGKCPFCPGNEEMTPQADLVLVKMGDTLVKQTDSEGDPVRGWIVRVFPDKFPIFTPNAAPSYGEPPHYSEPAIGHHYILVATPNHDLAFPKLDIDQWTNVLATVQDKTRWLYAQRGVGYVIIFINQGKAAGSHIDRGGGGGDRPELVERARGMPDVSSGRRRDGRAEADPVDRLFHRVRPLGLGPLL